VKYRFIEAQRSHYSVRSLCRRLKVSASGYYAACGRAPSACSQRQQTLIKRIESIHKASRATYGAPRIHFELGVQGVACCKNTVAQLTRRAGIVPKTVCRFKITTDSRHTWWAAPNLLGRVFHAALANQCWLTDTFIPTRAGWLYLAVILDLYSRAVAGWAMSERMARALVMDALAMAIERRGIVPDVLRADRGSFYTVVDYRTLRQSGGAGRSQRSRLCSLTRCMMSSVLGKSCGRERSPIGISFVDAGEIDQENDK